MIEFDHVTMRYGDTTALNDVSFRVPDGTVLGYIGPNGAGKTTTMKILTDMIRAYEGSVRVDGQPIEQIRKAFHRTIGYVPQDAGFQDWRTVRHALVTFGRLSGLESPGLEQRIDAATTRLGLSGDLDRRIVHLSGGTKQRLRLAQAILHEPRILVLDEPLSGLDAASRAELKRTIRDLAGEQRTILLSSHVLADVEDLASMIIIVNRGSVATAGTREELRRRHRIGNRIEVTGPAITDSAERFTGITSVTGIDSDGANRLVLQLDTGTALADAMRTVLRAAAVLPREVTGVRSLDPTLEDVYLSLTGGSDA